MEATNLARIGCPNISAVLLFIMSSAADPSAIWLAFPSVVVLGGHCGNAFMILPNFCRRAIPLNNLGTSSRILFRLWVAGTAVDTSKFWNVSRWSQMICSPKSWFVRPPVRYFTWGLTQENGSLNPMICHFALPPQPAVHRNQKIMRRGQSV